MLLLLLCIKNIMEISGGQPSSTSHHTQATSSSVIVQSSQPEEGVSLARLIDIHQLHHHHHHHQQQQQPQAPAASALGSGSITSPHTSGHLKLHQSLSSPHLQQTSAAHFGAARTSSSIQHASSSSASSPILSPPGKTLGRNSNGTSKLENSLFFFFPSFTTFHSSRSQLRFYLFVFFFLLHQC